MGFLQDLFGGKKQSQELQPNLVPTEVPGHRELRKSVKSRRMGFGPQFVERTTSPFVQELEMRFPETRREIFDVAGGAGLGRSSAVVRDVGKAAAQRDVDINKLIAEATLKDLIQQKHDVEQRDATLRALGLDEAAQANIFAESEMKRGEIQRGIRERNAAADTQFLNRLIGVPLAVGAGIATGQPELALSGFGIQSGMAPTSEASILRNVLENVSPFTRKKGTTRLRGGRFSSVTPEEFGFGEG
jgi:hypothetical protein